MAKFKLKVLMFVNAAGLVALTVLIDHRDLAFRCKCS